MAEFFGPYRVIRPLDGDRDDPGAGTVYLGESPDGLSVAIKVLSDPPIAGLDMRNVFAREAAVLRRVLRARNVIRFIDADLDAPVPWVVTEYVPGPSLADAVASGGRLTEASVRVIAAGIADALADLHQLGIVHGGVRPAHVLLSATGPVLAGFRFAKEADSETGPPDDISSLGAVLAFAATGETPSSREDGEDREDREDAEAAAPSRAARDLPLGSLTADIARVVAQCMEADPALRPTAAGLRRLIGFVSPARGWLRYDTEPRLPVQFETTDRAFSEVFTAPDRDLPSPARPPSPPRPPSPAGPASPPGPAPSADARPEPSLWYDTWLPREDPLAGQGPRPRHLVGKCPDGVGVGEPFSVLVSVVESTFQSFQSDSRLKRFAVGASGEDVLLVLHAPGYTVLGPHRQTVHVPFRGDSEPVMFELRANAPGPGRMTFTAWLKGTYLGELEVETQTEPTYGGHVTRTTSTVIEPSAVEGMVSLVVRYDPAQNTYRFEFRDEDNPEEVTSHLAYDPGPRVERLVGDLERLARGRGGYSAAETRDYLVNAGAGLWHELLPARLREQFWERQERIRQLTILADSDAVPWELLYPFDPGHDAGFLVEQFPVTRVVFGRRLPRSLNLQPAWFVLPDGSPQQAHDEVAALRGIVDVPSAPRPVITELTPLLDMIRNGVFGLLHFACHNTFDAAAGPVIPLDKRQFTPVQLTTTAISRPLARYTPLVFINACRSAGTSPSYQQLEGWARTFMAAGAGAFIGSLWAVRDSTARDFACELYSQLMKGTMLGKAVMLARQAAAASPGDPTWLAYTVYGDPRATLR